jgi:2'-5' RNA ligase
MSAIEVVAKPRFPEPEAKWLIQLRESRAHSPGSPEFTLVFPGTDFLVSDVVRHVEAVCARTQRIRFRLRSAVIVPDMGLYHVFLVPDEGFGAIIRLHEHLHVGPLAECLRPDVPYIPHLTVATADDFNTARRIKASLNANDFDIVGHIDEIEIHQRDATVPRCVARVALRHHGLFR